MLKIYVVTEHCIDTLEKNRADHVAEYASQMEGWKLKMQDHTNQVAAWAQGGGIGERPSEPQKPRDFTADYDWHIGYLKSHIHSTMVLEGDDYNKIILNKWRWKDEFLLNSAFYSRH